MRATLQIYRASVVEVLMFKGDETFRKREVGELESLEQGI